MSGTAESSQPVCNLRAAASKVERDHARQESPRAGDVARGLAGMV